MRSLVNMRHSAHYVMCYPQPLATDMLQLVQSWEKRRFTASQQRFMKKHIFSRFKDELLSLLKSTVPKLGEPRLQQVGVVVVHLLRT